jgi:hypothetical protein
MQINEYLYLAGVLNDREYYRILSEGAKDINCDICHKHAGDKYVDGGTRMGPWANMCMSCWGKHGVGKLGIGSGQMYDNKTGEQLEGGSKK